MVDRTTRARMENCFERFAKVMGKNVGHWKKEGDKFKPQIGNWVLDYNSVYGGAVIEELVNEQGGVDQPFGSQRRKPTEFCETLNFTERAIRLKEEKLKKVI